eukprot:m.8338 g.8338  ORF g.8338 m.8338 type:complete len:150 (-) comp3872_c0_seq2:1671-2120(-)
MYILIIIQECQNNRASKMASVDSTFQWYAGTSGSLPGKHIGAALRAGGGFPTETEVKTFEAKSTYSLDEFKATLAKCPAPDAALTKDLFSVFDKTGEGEVQANVLTSQISDVIGKGLITEKELKQVTKPYTTKGKLNYGNFVDAIVAGN